MTEVATEQTVRAPWNDVELDFRGRSLRLFRRGAEFWARLPEPDILARAELGGAPAPSVERQVVMTTGSHHYQAYWVPGVRGNELWQLPFIYHFESRRFIPRHAVFLQPADDPEHQARWNSNCIQCHSVAGRPGHDEAEDRFDTRTAELGIACEACHGAAAEHVARQRNPVTRHRAEHDAELDPTIVNPAHLSAERASEVCGQCHSYFVPRDAERWWTEGFADSYRPGDALDPSRHVFDYERDLPHASDLISSSLDSLFYADGTIRVGGREWNGLRRSACFEQGTPDRQLSCLSCHQLHGGSVIDQLKPAADSDQSCQGCHADRVANPSAHSHHSALSSGSRCVNCHMPFTTYALFKAIRSHRITRPNAIGDPGGAGAPNACNLCHQDRNSSWSADWMKRWYPGSEAPSSDPEEPSAAAIGLLRGDAATRVIFADQLGWEPARRVSGDASRAQLLVEALDDPYAAVRFVAHRSLTRLPGFGDFSYDFVAERRTRLARQAEARTRLSSAPLPRELIDELIATRDNRPIRIAE